jgi:DNA-binding GntR family transcriptional regulator
MATRATAPPTRAEWVDTQLRRAILHGELLPGEKLLAEHLAERWGVSPTPLRETFMRLAGEGLVVIEPQRGARVAPLSVEEAAEIYELRLLLDPVALQRSMVAAAGDPAYVEGVELAHARLESRHRSVSAHHDAHRAFHLALVSRCPNGRLLRHVTQLLDHSQRFHAAGIATVRRVDPVVEHRQLVDAVRAGDRRTAVAVLRAHLSATLAAVEASA